MPFQPKPEVGVWVAFKNMWFSIEEKHCSDSEADPATARKSKFTKLKMGNVYT